MINRYASLRQGLVGCWCPSVSGSFGFRLPDLSGYGNAGTLNGFALSGSTSNWVASGRMALDFDGVNDFVASASSKQFADLSTDSLTFSFWNKNDTGTTGIYAGLTNSTNSNPFFWTQASGTQIYFGHRNNSGGDSGITTGVWQSATWRLLTLVSTPASITVYQNGLQLGTTSRTASATTLNVMTLGCANRANAQNSFAITQLDDIRIYNRVLTPSEIRLLYTGGRGVGLVPERIKHRRKTAAAATNRRRRLICGANC